MKILQLHADFIEYRPIKKEIPSAEEAKTESVRQRLRSSSGSSG